jgi:hypothetical protein
MVSRTELLRRGTPLARALPGARFTEGHSRIVAAPPQQVWRVLHELRWSDLRITVPLMAVRAAAAGPGGVRRAADPGTLNRRLVDPPSPAAPVFEDPPRVSASGMIGRPWQRRPEPGPTVTDLDQLRAFDEPGWLKFGMEWVLSPLPGERTLVETATLCEPTDAAAARRFAGYWVVIRGFSGLIRRDILAAVARAVS